MTNRERLQSYDDKTFGEKIRALGKSIFFDYVDLDAWMKSESPDFIFVGKKGNVSIDYGGTGEEKTYPCVVVGYKHVMGYPYRQVIVGSKREEYQLLSVPVEKVTIFK